MTRMSKQGERRAKSPRKHRPAAPKTGPKRDQLEFGYRTHQNAVAAEAAAHRFIPKMS